MKALDQSNFNLISFHYIFFFLEKGLYRLQKPCSVKSRNRASIAQQSQSVVTKWLKFPVEKTVSSIKQH